MFAMVDNFGLNSLYLSTTPDDECSFRVRLYLKPQNWVSSCKIKTKTFYSKLELNVDFRINFLLDALYSKLELYVDFGLIFLLNAYLFVFLPLYVSA
jgi:hypothetical protein